jgi:hypothetical protein
VLSALSGEAKEPINMTPMHSRAAAGVLNFSGMRFTNGGAVWFQTKYIGFVTTLIGI